MIIEPNVVLLHGFGTSSREWAHVAEQLAGVRPLHPDLPGFGTCAAHGARNLREMGDFVASAIEHAGYRRFVLVGREMGAQVALELATRELPGLLGVVLVDPAWPATNATASLLRGAHGSEEALRAYYRRPGAALDDRDLENLVLDGLRASPDAWTFWLDPNREEAGPPLTVPLSLPVLILSRDGAEVPSLPQATIQTVTPDATLLSLQAPQILTRQLLHWTNSLFREASA